MQFKTNIDISKYPLEINYKKNIFLTGSCFADHIGQRFSQNKFSCLCNPLGIHFNPVSLARSIQYITGKKKISKDQLAWRDGRWHHFDFHGVFSQSTEEATLQGLNDRFLETAAFLKTADYVFITLGTAQVHHLLSSGLVVSNNHKFPSDLFRRSLLTESEVHAAASQMVSDLRILNPAVRIIFTVSPVRYIRNGMHENQLSKAVLLLATESLRDDENVFYFPAYEIFMDDLRDYRFYEEDMVHPAKTGVDYVWELLTRACMDDITLQKMKEVQKLRLSFLHRPIYEESEEYKKFLTSLKEDMKQMMSDDAGIDFSEEIKTLELKLSGLLSSEE